MPRRNKMADQIREDQMKAIVRAHTDLDRVYIQMLFAEAIDTDDAAEFLGLVKVAQESLKKVAEKVKARNAAQGKGAA